MAKKQKSRGRRPALDQALIESLVEQVRRVFYNKHAIEALGYSERVLYYWLERGETEMDRMDERGLVKPAPNEKTYVDLVVAMRRARAENVRAHVTNIQRHALGQPAQYLKSPDGTVIVDKDGRPTLLQSEIPSQWQPSARYLEAVEPELWGRKVRTEISVPDGGPTELKITVVRKREVAKEFDDDVSS